MFRRTLLLFIPLVIFLSGAVVVVAFEQQRTPDWQQALDRWLLQTRTPGATVQVLGAGRAAYPRNFRAGMGIPAIQADEWTWQIERLPYPPDSLYCVVLERALAPANNSPAPAQQLLYLAHHTDGVWRAGWLVHEGPIAPFDDDVAADLAVLGCDPGTALSGSE